MPLVAWIYSPYPGYKDVTFMVRWVVGLTLLFGALASPWVEACELVMGYRTNGRLPLIQAAPSNAGLYRDLYRQAAADIGCRLEIRRLPKRRVLLGLQSGEIDFYPGFSFNRERAHYAQFIANGLSHGYGILSRRSQADIHTWSDLRGKVAVIATGASTELLEQHQIRLAYVHDLDLPKAARLLMNSKADVYLYDNDTINYFLKQHPDLPLKSHPCCDPRRAMFLGFSRRSRHFSAENNPDYDPGRPLAPDNQPRLPADGSVAARLAKALSALKQQGAIDRLYQGYYRRPDSP